MSEEEYDEVEKQSLKIVQDAVRELRKHFDTVDIFVTSDVPGEQNTQSITWGEGHWFARLGFIQYWLRKCKRREDSEP